MKNLLHKYSPDFILHKVLIDIFQVYLYDWDVKEKYSSFSQSVKPILAGV